MFVNISRNLVYVRLSRRNVRQLNAMLTQSSRDAKYLARRDEDGTSIIVQVEDDADHYDGRYPGPGAGELA